MFPDRSRRADYDLLDIEEYRNDRVARDSLGLERTRSTGLPYETFISGVNALQKAVAKIQNRGGDVVLVRLPTGSRLWANRDAVFPKDRYWDVLAARTSALTLHFKDVPEMQGFHPPDESHLDYRDAPSFTRSFVTALRARGLFLP